ncbi:PHB depolymerase family esterase [Variovorax sp. PCZ-1]|uniref:alpha/beta hydrolase family esterase n=1 Tax=Variovorax sp. PCZ-1 TaxID=2835533 RepID=UPI001BCC8C08|nr:PHB depolymerase family esterase [Variovorax sp. PCZ-1]MBS7807872.1 prolyl oligopeptidase family serine peptidase [Variovorax sp. PCZ-1]
MKAFFHHIARIVLASSILLASCGGGGDAQAAQPAFTGKSGDFTKTISVAGVSRRFLLHVPTSYNSAQPMSAVLLFHGGQGSAASIGRITSSSGSGFSGFASQKNFIAIYPDSVNGTWDDGRATITNKTNDVAFTAAILDALVLEYNIDAKRIYAAGISNGGMLTQRLACELPGRFAAVASVVANLPSDIQASCNPSPALPIAIFSGDADPLMPYAGGSVAGVFGGNVLFTTATVAFWAAKNSVSLSSTITLPDTDLTDGSTTDLLSYTGTGRGEVAFYRSKGGGHAWPGGTQYTFVSVIGKVVKDFSANEAMWAFFSRHAKH